MHDRDRTPDHLSTTPSHHATHGATHGTTHDTARDATHDAAHHAAHAAGAGDVDTERQGHVSPGTVAAGAAGGMMAGLQAGALAGAVTLGVGALVGATLGAVGGATVDAASGVQGYDATADAHYRGLYEQGRPAGDRRYEDVRAAYAFGHLAAQEPSLAGRPFAEVEPELRHAWTDELSSRAGPWDAVRAHVRDAYGHARAEGAGERRRTESVVGSAGSAVDPVELARTDRGDTSDGRPIVGPDVVDERTSDMARHDASLHHGSLHDASRHDAPLHDTPRGRMPGSGTAGEVGANTAHKRDPELH